MNHKKYNWEQIFNDCVLLLNKSFKINNVEPINNVSKLHEKLSEKYKKENKENECPGMSVFRQRLHDKLNVKPNCKIVKEDLYKFAGAYHKMTLKVLSENITIHTDAVADNTSWIFIRLNAKKNTSNEKNKHFYYLSSELKKKFSKEILFVSFDSDTLVIMCSNNKARNKIISYFEKSIIDVTIISDEET